MDDLKMMSVKSIVDCLSYDELSSLSLYVKESLKLMELQKDKQSKEWGSNFKKQLETQICDPDFFGRISDCTSNEISIFYKGSRSSPADENGYALYILSPREINITEISGYDDYSCTRQITSEKFPFDYVSKRWIDLFRLYLTHNPKVELEINW